MIVSIAGKSQPTEFAGADRLGGTPGIDALELNCPAQTSAAALISAPIRRCASRWFRACAGLLAADPGQAHAERHRRDAHRPGGRGPRADALSLVNTCLGMAVDGRRRRPRLGNVLGGLSGPAIKPIALRIVYQVYRAVKIPLVGIGGIATIDDVMEFLVAGATAVQVGTANFYRPTAAIEILDALPRPCGPSAPPASAKWSAPCKRIFPRCAKPPPLPPGEGRGEGNQRRTNHHFFPHSPGRKKKGVRTIFVKLGRQE